MPKAAHNIELNIGNATPADAQFFRALTALFTDPALAPHLADLRQGNLGLRYGPDGSLHLIAIVSTDLNTQLN